jgi:hypothetical protein
MKITEIFDITFIDRNLPKSFHAPKKLLLLMIGLFLCYNIPTNAMGLKIGLEGTFGKDSPITWVFAIFLSSITEIFAFVSFTVFFSTLSKRMSIIVCYIAFCAALGCCAISFYLSYSGLDDLNNERLERPVTNTEKIQAIHDQYADKASEITEKFLVSDNSTIDASIAIIENRVSEIEKQILQTSKASVNKLRDLKIEKSKLETQKAKLFSDKRSAGKENTANLKLMKESLKDLNSEKEKELSTVESAHKENLEVYQADINKGSNRAWVFNLFVGIANFLANIMFSLLDADLAKNTKKAFIWFWSFGLKETYFDELPVGKNANVVASQVQDRYKIDDYNKAFDKYFASHYEVGMEKAEYARIVTELMEKKEHLGSKSIESYVGRWYAEKGLKLNTLDAAKETSKVSAEPVKVAIEKPDPNKEIVEAETEEDLDSYEEELKEKVLLLYNKLGMNTASIINEIDRLNTDDDKLSNHSKQMIKHWIETEGKDSRQSKVAIDPKERAKRQRKKALALTKALAKAK